MHRLKDQMECQFFDFKLKVWGITRMLITNWQGFKANAEWYVINDVAEHFFLYGKEFHSTKVTT
jgi:hypothetical protein